MRKTLQNPNNHTSSTLKQDIKPHCTVVHGSDRVGAAELGAPGLISFSSKTFPLFMAKCDLLELQLGTDIHLGTVMIVISFTFFFFYQTQSSIHLVM